NLPHQFSCRSEGWDPHNRPLVTWHLNGRRQREQPPSGGRLLTRSQGQSEVIPSGDRPNSTFSLRPRKWSRELVCEASNPRTGQKFNASVTLSLQLKPEILGVDANQSSDPGLVLVLFALVRSSPPATVSFVDQSGQLVANTSDFLLLDSQTHPWLANHTLRILLSSLSGNLSLKLSHSVGPVQSNLTLAEFLQSRVEVPMLGIVTGGAMALMALLTLTFILLCLMQKNKKTAGSGHAGSGHAGSGHAGSGPLPRDHMSLPTNVKLNDLSTLTKGRESPSELLLLINCLKKEAAQQNPGGKKTGFARYPMVGYIYKVNSTSSEEIWL
uniref:Transmembrane protein 25 n=1 Tax=Tetraodon nigroviridis TaxID=99883 RepID=H3CLT1_TETNG